MCIQAAAALSAVLSIATALRERAQDCYAHADAIDRGPRAEVYGCAAGHWIELGEALESLAGDLEYRLTRESAASVLSQWRQELRKAKGAEREALACGVELLEQEIQQ